MGEDYEEAFRARAKESAMIRDLGIELQIEPGRISDSASGLLRDSVVEEGKKIEAPLIESIGIGGTDALAAILASMGRGELSPEQVAIILKTVFGMDEAAAQEIIDAQPSKEQVTPAPAQAQASFEESYKPTQGMIAEAKKGLEWRAKYGRGGTNIGVARARDISNGKNLSEDTVKRMNSYFARHEVDKKGEGFEPGEDGFPSAGRIAWALWGGDAGQVWAADKAKGMKLATRPERKHLAIVLRDAHGHFQGIGHETDLVMPSPELREEDEDFIDRCMVHPTMESEYPDNDQRLAVCMTQLAVVGERGGIKASPKAPKSDTPNKDPQGEGTAKGDASGKRGAEVTAEQEKTLQNKADEFNEKDSNTKNGRATLGALKSVFQRGLGAFNTSHSPRVQSAEQWAFARVNAFLYLLKNGRPENPNYTTDNDLLPKEHPKA
jgi:hypothetical protein